MTRTSLVAAASSEHPLATQATGECLGELLEVSATHGFAPDLVLVAATPALEGVLEDVTRAVRDVLAPGALVAVVGRGLVGGGREVAGGPGLAMFGLWCGAAGAVDAVRIDPGGAGLDRLDGRRGTAVMLGDAFSVDPEQVLARLLEGSPGLAVAGGLLSAATRPGGCRIGLDDAWFRDGGVALWFAADLRVDVVVSAEVGEEVRDPSGHDGAEAAAALLLLSDQRDGSALDARVPTERRVGVACGVQFATSGAVPGVHEGAVVAVVFP